MTVSVPEQLYFTADDVLDRVEEVDDMFDDPYTTSGIVPAR